MPRKVDAIEDTQGKRFGRWQVLAFSHWQLRKDGRRSDHWLCRCDCGTEKTVKGTSMRVGTSVSCGCFNREMSTLKNTLAEGDGTRNHFYAQYRQGARRRDIDFSLTRKEFYVLIGRPCHYCGTPPEFRIVSDRLNGGCVAGGIDRKDNTLGYTPSNSVPCCRTCNIGKGDQPYEEWIAYLERLVTYRRA